MSAKHWLLCCDPGMYLIASVTSSGYCSGTALSRASLTSCARVTMYSLKLKLLSLVVVATSSLDLSSAALRTCTSGHSWGLLSYSPISQHRCTGMQVAQVDPPSACVQCSAGGCVCKCGGVLQSVEHGLLAACKRADT